MSGRILLLVPLATLFAACSPAQAPGDSTASSSPASAAPTATLADVALVSASGSSVNGALQLEAVANAVKVQGEIGGLVPGSIHGFHFHENGDCSAPDASSAGAHFNPDHVMHGGPDAAQKHLGDLQNITADGQGTATVQMLVNGATLRDGSSHDLVGRAVVVHEAPDDYISQPSGDSGGRIACGVVR